MKIIQLRGQQLQQWKDNPNEVEKALVAQHGDCQLRSTQGKILKFCRVGDRVPPPPTPELARIQHQGGRTIYGAPLPSINVTELPCVQNVNATLPRVQAADINSLAMLGPTPEPVPALAIRDQDQDCCSWLGVLPKGEHHAACAKASKAAPQLLDLKTGTPLRAALPDEIQASKASSQLDGVGEISVDGRACYVSEQASSPTAA